MGPYKALGLEDVMPFGKFKGTKIRALLFNELPYMEWVMKNTGLNLDESASAKMEELQEIAQGPGDGEMRFGHGGDR